MEVPWLVLLMFIVIICIFLPVSAWRATPKFQLGRKFPSFHIGATSGQYDELGAEFGSLEHFEGEMRLLIESSELNTGIRAEEVLSQMLSAGHMPSEETAQNYIRAMASASVRDDMTMAPERALRALDRVLGYGVPPTSSLYNAAIEAWGGEARRRPDAAARSRELFDRMVYSNTEPNCQTFVQLMELWTRLGYDEGIDALMDMSGRRTSARRLALTPDDHRRCLRALAERPSLDNADRMRRICEQMELFTKENMGSHDYHLLIAIYGNITPITQDTVTLIQQVFREMLSTRNITPLSASYMVLARAYCGAARGLIRESSVQGEGDVSSPSMSSQYDDAYKLVARAREVLMSSNENDPAKMDPKDTSRRKDNRATESLARETEAAYNALIDVLCQLDRVTEAHAVYDDAIAREVSLTTLTYNSLFAAYGTACSSREEGDGDDYLIQSGSNMSCPPQAVHIAVADVEALFTKMTVAPDPWTYSTLIVLLCRLGKAPRALHYFREAVDRGLMLDLTTYELLLAHVGDDASVTEELFVGMCATLKHQAASSGLQGRGLDTCEEALDQIRRSRATSISLPMYEALFRAYLLRPTAASAERASVHLNRLLATRDRGGGDSEEEVNVHIRPSHEMYLLLMELWGRSGMSYGPERAEELAHFMEALGMQLTPDVYELLLKAWLHSNRIDSPKRCENLFRDLYERGLEASPTSFELLMRAWAKSGLPSAADKCWEVLRTMEEGLEIEVPQRLLGVMAMSLVERWRGRKLAPEGQREVSMQMQALVNRARRIVERKGGLLDGLLCRAAFETWSMTPDDDTSPRRASSLVRVMAETNTSVPSCQLFHTLAAILPNGVHDDEEDRLLEGGTLHGPKDGGSRAVHRLRPPSVLSASSTLLNLHLAAAGSAEEAQEIFVSALLTEPRLQPDVTSYNLLLESSVASGLELDAVEELLDRLLRHTSPNHETFQVMADVWGKEDSGRLASGSDYDAGLWKTEALFNALSRKQRERALGGVGGNTTSRSPPPGGVPLSLPRATNLRMIKAWCAPKRPALCERATSLLFKMAQEGASQGSIATALDAVVAGWIRCGRRDRAHQLFNTLLLTSAARPSAGTCKRLIDAFTGAPRSVSGIEAAQEVYGRAIAAGMRHDAECVIRILRAWALVASGIAPARTERFLVENMARGLSPSVELFNVLLDVYAKSGLQGAPEMCEKLLFERLPELKIAPTIVTYNTVMAAWARSQEEVAFARADRVFQAARQDGSVALNCISYSSLLSSLSKAPDKVKAAEIAETIFQDLLDMSVVPDLQCWTTFIGILAKEGSPERAQATFERMIDSGCDPNGVTYTTMLTMWGASQSPEASGRVLQIFRQMRASGHTLDTIGFTSLISAIGRSVDADAPTRAMDVFSQMRGHGLAPDLHAYTILISILAKAGREEDAQALYESLLHDGIEPSEVTFTTLLNMWSKSRSVEAAQHIENVYEALCNANVVADGRLFRSLGRALGKCNGRLGIARKMEMLLRRIVDFGARPDALAFQTVLTSYLDCVPDSPAAIERVVSLLDLMGSIGRAPSKRAFFPVFGKITEQPNGHPTRRWTKKQGESKATAVTRDRGSEYRAVLECYERCGFRANTRNFNQLLYLELQGPPVDGAAIRRVARILDELKMRGLVADKMTHKNVLALADRAAADGMCDAAAVMCARGMASQLTQRT